MKIFFAYLGMISFTVIANLLLKMGATSSHYNQENNLWIIFFNWKIILGLSSYFSAALFYIIILKWLPLNIAQSFAALQFIVVIIASSIVLGESIDYIRWSGIFFIFIGIMIVSQSIN